jgi:hypothetical protein
MALDYGYYVFQDPPANLEEKDPGVRGGYRPNLRIDLATQNRTAQAVPQAGPDNRDYQVLLRSGRYPKCG